METEQYVTAMVVDDVADMRSLLKMTLSQCEVKTIAEVGRGRAAIDHYRHGPADMVFLDINLPDASGIDVLKVLRQIDPTAYVVMISGDSTVDNVKESLQAGASGFVSKPYNLAKIATAVDRFRKQFSG